MCFNSRHSIFLILLSLRSAIFESTKNDQQRTPLPTSNICNNKSIVWKWNGICKHVKNFKKPSIPLLRKRHKCISPFWFFKNWVVTCLNADEILNFIEIQSRYLLLSNQSNEDYVFHYISYFLNNFSIDIWSILSTTNSLPFIISS